MKNPWTKKNPFLSMWLSGANAIAGAARGRATAAAKAQTTQAAKRGTSAWLGLFSRAMPSPKDAAPAAPAEPATKSAAAKPARKAAAARKPAAASGKRRRKAR